LKPLISYSAQEMIFNLVLLIASFAGGLIAAISGFGIGSVLTPAISTQIDTKLAVAAVSIPHLIGTFIRFLKLRKKINRPLAVTFGVASAIGGLAGAIMNAYANGSTLGYVFGALLVFAGLSGLTGIAERIELKGPWRWIGGFASAAFGGLVGNQGGIRSAAMLGFALSKESFVATATVIALVVDGARMPVYFVTQRQELLMIWPTILIATVGVVIGTFVGSRLLGRIPERMFKRIVSLLVFGLGVYMLVRPIV
jgi:uncharacterized membrane protein YfcA